MDSILQGTHHHFLCCLPGNIGTFSSFMLKLFFSGIRVDEEQPSVLRKTQKDGIIIYLIKYKSNFEYFFYHTRYQQMGLPVPEIGLGYRIIGWQPISRILRILTAHLDYLYKNRSFPDPYRDRYIEQELLKGRSALLALVEEKGFYRRFVKKETDPLEYLIRLQKSIDRTIYIVPHLMFFTKKPQRAIPTLIDILFGSEGKPGKLRRLVLLFKNPGNVFVEVSEPVNLKHFTEADENRKRSIEHQALVLRRNLLIQVNRHRQTITGPILKSREELKESILTNDQLQDFMKKHSEKRKIPLPQIYKKADSYLEEIAANYSLGLIRIYSGIIKWIAHNMFDGITVNRNELNIVKKMYQKGPLILIPCHKSHIDYLVLNYVLYNNNMPVPHVAAGSNLSFWPMGPLFRGGGAFFIRRTFRGAILYSKVFAGYIKKLLEDGFNIEFYIEGGRSRTGKLILPKLGLLSILLNAYKEGACDDMIFVPIFIGYDRILEERSYLNEIEGGQKKPESLLQIIKARKFLKRRYGRIYIRFHEPISLNEVLSQNGSSINEMNQKEMNVLCRNLGFRVINAIDRVTVVTPHAIVAGAILNCSRKKFTRAHIVSHIETCMNHLHAQKVQLADTLIMNPTHAFDQVFEAYTQRKFIERISKDKETDISEIHYTVDESSRPLLEYYKNNCISFFIPAAFTAMSILDKDAFQFSASELHGGYQFLQNFFKHEFAYDIDKTIEHFVRKTIKSFIDDVILMPHPTLPDIYNITSVGLRKLKFYAHFLKPYFESYRIVLNYFSQKPREKEDKDRIKKIQALGTRMFKQEKIELVEALSKVNYINAVTYFTTHEVKSSDDIEKINFYLEKIDQYLSWIAP